MMKLEYQVKNNLGVPMRYEELYGQKVAIYEIQHKQALRKLLKVMDINTITNHYMYVVPGRFIWKRDI